ncbi:MAG: hypothetical protein II551_01895 [Paludibacteraceae bacterium]|nr:hypothetical protein [Paludibacteraceae bacterium]
MNSQQFRVVALALMVGALPFLFPLKAAAEGADPPASEAKPQNPWLDDYRQKVGFTYGAEATLQTNYVWRGLYCGGLSLQGSANVGYGGLYADMWWSLGATDYAFRAFQPEVDLSLGFRRWGLDVSVLYIHNFNRPFFDIHNYAPGQPGNCLEVRGRYTVSSKLPLSFLWATRVSARDGYIDSDGNLQRAFSSYIELSYTHRFANDISLYGAIGITPWRSMYTRFVGGATVCNIHLRCSRDWQVSEHCGLRLGGEMMLHPYYLAHKEESEAMFDYRQLGSPALNANIGFTVFLIK